MNHEIAFNMTASERIAESLYNIETILAMLLAMSIINSVTMIIVFYRLRRGEE